MRSAAWKEHAAPLAWLFAVALVPLGTAPWTGRVPWFSDIVNVDFPIRAYVRDCLARGEVPLWNPHSACGLPFLADPNTALFYPPAWFLQVFAPPVALLVDIVLHLFAAGALTYAAARIRGTSRTAAALAGTVFAMSGVAFEQIQLPGNLRALALTPALVAGAALIARGSRRRGFVVAAVGWTLALLAGHPQLAACAVPVAAAVAWGDAPSGARIRALLLTAGAVVVGTLVAGAALAPAAEFVRVSQRSLGISAAMLDNGSLGVRDLARTVFARTEFVEQMALGAAAVVLTALASVTRPRASWALLAAAAFGLLASLGDATPLGRALHAVPPFAYFQYPGRHVGTAALALALLAGDGLDAWRNSATATARTRLVVACGLVALVATAFFSSPGSPTSHDALKLAAIAAVVAAFLLGPRMKPTAGAALLVALAAADLAVENGRAYWRSDHVAPIRSAAAEPAILAAIPDDARDGSYRILTSNTPWHWHNRPTAFGIDNARGHVAFTPMRLLDLSRLINDGAPFPRVALDGPLYSYSPLAKRSRLLDLYAVRYAVGFERAPSPAWRERAPGMYERDCAMRAAEFVPQARFVSSDEDAAKAVAAADFDPTRTVVVEGEVDSNETAGEGPDARVVEIRRSAGGIRVRLAPGRAGWLFAGWSRLPGFEATVDGAPAPILPANLAFMAVRLPAGARDVELRYLPAGLVLGAWVSAAGLATLAAAAWMLERPKGPAGTASKQDLSEGAR